MQIDCGCKTCNMIHQFPIEIIRQILEYLPLSDQLQCSLVCRQFLNAFRSSGRRVREKTSVTFVGDEQFSNNFESVIKNVCIGSLTLKETSISPTIWSDGAIFLSQLTTLRFINSSVTNRDLFSILQNCTSLKHLGLVNCRELFICGLQLFKEEEESVKLKASLKNVEEIDLSANKFLTDCIFEEIVSYVKPVKSIILDDCKIFSGALDHVSHARSPSRLTSGCVLSVVASTADELTKLSVRNSSFGAESLRMLGHVRGLSLMELDVCNCSSINQEAMLDFSARQRQLRKLNIDWCRRILVDNPERSLTIFEALNSLESLSMKGISMSKGFEDCLVQLDNLKTLDISSVDVTDSQVTSGLLKSKFNLQSLFMVNFTINPDKLTTIIPRLSRVVELNFNHSAHGITDQVLGEIIKHAKLLKFLQLNHCSRLTDLGFTGIAHSLDVTQIPGVREIAWQSGKMFPGTRAEAQLLDQIRRQKEVEEKVASSSIEMESTRIDALNLKILNISSVNLTDSALRLAFAFKELRSVDLSDCKRITDDGFACIAKNNPSLEKLVASRTYLTDVGFASTVQNLPRLAYLDVEGCSALTGESIKQLPLHCKYLKFLNVSFCLKVKSSVVEFIQTQLSLHQVEMRGLFIADCLDD